MDSIKKIDTEGNIFYQKKNVGWHREDGPAIEYITGYKAWYINNKRHREDGPAKIWSDGDSEYWLNDKYYTKEDWEYEIAKRKLEKLKDL